MVSHRNSPEARAFFKRPTMRLAALALGAQLAIVSVALPLAQVEEIVETLVIRPRIVNELPPTNRIPSSSLETVYKFMTTSGAVLPLVEMGVNYPSEYGMVVLREVVPANYIQVSSSWSA